VTGGARYSAEFPVAKLAYGVTIQSAIAKAYVPKGKIPNRRVSRFICWEFHSGTSKCCCPRRANLVGAERFGWQKRNPTPRSMRDGNYLIDWGMATATYPTNRSPASAIANAVYHATGKRIRDLPITLDKLL
jgi:hypothetical protein